MGEDIVTLLWFCQCFRRTDRKLTVVCGSSSNFADVHYDEHYLSSKVKVTRDLYSDELNGIIETTIMCIFIKLCRHVNHGKRMILIDFGGQGHFGPCIVLTL